MLRSAGLRLSLIPEYHFSHQNYCRRLGLFLKIVFETFFIVFRHSSKSIIKMLRTVANFRVTYFKEKIKKPSGFINTIRIPWFDDRIWCCRFFQTEQTVNRKISGFRATLRGPSHNFGLPLPFSKELLIFFFFFSKYQYWFLKVTFLIFVIIANPNRNPTRVHNSYVVISTWFGIVFFFKLCFIIIKDTFHLFICNTFIFYNIFDNSLEHGRCNLKLGLWPLRPLP